jgi:hypothetical protein
MATRFLLDTDVLVDYSRQLPAAVKFVRGLSGRPIISAVTVAELYAGVRNGRERADLDVFISTLVTLNVKHFPMLLDVLVPYQKA